MGLRGWWGGYLDVFEPSKLSLQLISGYLFYPVSFLLGVPRGDDLLKVSKLIAEKVIVASCRAHPPFRPLFLSFLFGIEHKLIRQVSQGGF